LAKDEWGYEIFMSESKSAVYALRKGNERTNGKAHPSQWFESGHSEEGSRHF
jgi:hypothetical protein